MTSIEPQRSTRYWLIAPVEANPPELFDKVWQFDLANNLISIGWSDLGDVSQLSREQLSELVASTYDDKPAGTKGLYTNMVWAFYHEVRPGDVIVARRGRKALAAIGKVNGTAFFAPGKNPNVDHPNFLEVSWQEQPRDRIYPTLVFPMHTLSEWSADQVENLLKGSGTQFPPSETQGIEDPTEFVLERYLEDFIVSNFQAIFGRRLTIYRDSDGNEGQQYATEIGPIDILAVENKTNSYVVIELKKGRPSDQVMGQILRYMGWVKQNLCKEGQGVKGLVICRHPDPKLSFALSMTNNIDVQYYTVSFRLSPTP